jgi:hypothetical protein
LAILCTILDGTLERHTDGLWRWRDGTPEPRARDQWRSVTFDFRVRHLGDETCLEVPLVRAEADPELRWVRAAYELGGYQREGEVILIPLTEWTEWIATVRPLGAAWDSADEAAILERAWALGWRG